MHDRGVDLFGLLSQNYSVVLICVNRATITGRALRVSRIDMCLVLEIGIARAGESACCRNLPVSAASDRRCSADMNIVCNDNIGVVAVPSTVQYLTASLYKVTVLLAIPLRTTEV